MTTPAESLPEFRPRSVVRRTLTWYADHARDLPWRQPGTSPWAVMVSEFMLQQTPVERVRGPWQLWMDRWPTPDALAATPAGEAVRAWGRLGYPRRALRLHQAAVIITERFDGQVPDDRDSLLSLPGVGSYTAAAIASFAFGRREIVLDTNVRRVLSRVVFGRAYPPANLTAGEMAAAERLAPRDPPLAARWAVASMELGAVVCVARAPRCDACPVRDLCAWRAAGSPAWTGPPRRGQAYAGTDRQCRGALLAVLRSSDIPVGPAELEAAWPDTVQRERALTSLIADGLVVTDRPPLVTSELTVEWAHVTGTSAIAPTVELQHGTQIPVIGIGTSPLRGSESTDQIRTAIESGYRLIDTAENYRNEASVGQGIRDSGIDRAELFITSKFNRQWHSMDGVRDAYQASLERLGLDYLDLFLVHWPNPDQDRYVEAVQGLNALLESGDVRAIGVSSFKPAHLQRVLDETGIIPDVNQIQLSPYGTRVDSRTFNQAHGIVTESWSPLGASSGELRNDPVITAIAAAYGKSATQVVLRWHVQLGLVAIPKSGNPGRIAENIDIFDFELTADEIDRISALDRGDAEITDSDVVGH